MNATEQALVSLWGTLSPDQQRQKWALISIADREEIERLLPGTKNKIIRRYTRLEKVLQSAEGKLDKGWPY